MVHTGQRLKDKATLIKETFYDLELEEECADIFDKFPWVISERDETRTGNKVNNQGDHVQV